MSEYKIVIGYHTLAGEFCVVNGDFSNLCCLMNTNERKMEPTLIQTQFPVFKRHPVSQRQKNSYNALSF